MKVDGKETELKENSSCKIHHEANVRGEVMVSTSDTDEASPNLQLNIMNDIEKLKLDVMKLTKQGDETMDKLEIILRLLNEK